jgi:hypothetical protein
MNVQRKLNRQDLAAYPRIDPTFQKARETDCLVCFLLTARPPEVVAKPIIHSATKYIGQRAQKKVQPGGAIWIVEIRIDSMRHEDVAAGGNAFSRPRIFCPFVGIISVTAKETTWTYLSEERGRKGSWRAS